MKTLASAQPCSFVLVVVTIGYTFSYTVKNVSTMANLGMETAARWSAPPSTQWITPASRSTGESLCSGVLATASLFEHPWDSLALRVKWIHQKRWQGNMDQTARWRKGILTRLLANHTECFRGEHSDSQKGAALLSSMQVYWYCRWQHTATPCGWQLFETWKEGVKRPGNLNSKITYP